MAQSTFLGEKFRLFGRLALILFLRVIAFFWEALGRLSMLCLQRITTLLESQASPKAQTGPAAFQTRPNSMTQDLQCGVPTFHQYIEDMAQCEYGSHHIESRLKVLSSILESYLRAHPNCIPDYEYFLEQLAHASDEDFSII